MKTIKRSNAKNLIEGPQQASHARSRIGALLLSATLASVASAAQPDPAKTRAYIDQAWTTLTRSMDDCGSLVDTKVATRPVLYIPAQFPVPADVADVQKRCNVDIRTLPSVIDRLGAVDATTLPVQGLLYLPHPYIVPGGFFNEMYGWDSYFILLGLIADHRTDLARDMTDNALFEVQYYGGVLNANRTYYLSRSQPPFLSAMMAAVMHDPASFHSAAEKRAWLEHAYPLAIRNYEIWTRPEHQAAARCSKRRTALSTTA
jgi:alpha,alpha-trehalase